MLYYVKIKDCKLCICDWLRESGANQKKKKCTVTEK